MGRWALSLPLTMIVLGSGIKSANNFHTESGSIPLLEKGEPKGDLLSGGG
jgi:hypothetical protein